MKEFVAELLQGVSVSNGLVRFVFASKTQDHIIGDKSDDNSPESLDPSYVITMPITGLIYSAGVMRNLIDSKEMQVLIDRYVDAGLLSRGENDDNKNTDVVEEVKDDNLAF